MMYTDHGSDVSIVLFCWFCVSCDLFIFNAWPLRPSHSQTAQKNSAEELGFASFFYTQFENSNDVIPMQ